MNDWDESPRYADYRAWRDDAMKRMAAGESPLEVAKDRPMYYDRQGRALSLREWSQCIERGSGLGYKIVARTTLPDGSWLSTVWLGLDHNYGEGPPLIFETMRFEGQVTEKEWPTVQGIEPPTRTYQCREEMEFPDPDTGEPTSQLRYSTEEEALLAHNAILARLGLDTQGVPLTPPQ